MFLLLLIGFAFLVPFASTDPDGLEKVAETLEIVEPEPFWKGFMPDYTLSAIENPYLSTLLAGFIGAVLVLGVSFALGKAITRSGK
ncbi:MAG: PDGLE domain-containing protein [Candidatus Bathyarchaeia archaeon]